MQELPPPLFATLGEILASAPAHPSGYALYLPDDEVWELSTRCALISPDDIESDEQEEPFVAVDAGLRYALDGGTLKEIYDNLKQQVAVVDAALLLNAFLFYYDNDAFICL